MAALELSRQADKLTAEAIRDRAIRVLELGLQLDPATLEATVRRLRIAAGQARPTLAARVTAGLPEVEAVDRQPCPPNGAMSDFPHPSSVRLAPRTSVPI